VIHNVIFRHIGKALLIMLVISFVFWGVGDMFNSKNTDNYAIKVGSEEYSWKKWDFILENNLRDYKLKYGTDISQEESVGFKNSVAKEIIDSTLLSIEAKNLGISINDNMVKKEILKIPVFFKGGKFSPELFEKIIGNYGLNEEQFVEKIKEELIRNIFIESFSGNKLVTEDLIALLLNNFFQKKNVEIMEIPFSAFDTKEDPDTEKLKEIYDKNKDLFIISDKRFVDYILISQDIVDDHKFDIGDDEINSIYESKKELFMDDDKRHVLQVKFESLKNAKAALDDLSNNVDFEKVIKKYSPNFKKSDLGIVNKGDFDEDITKKIFSLGINQNTDIIETPLGLYIFKVVKILPKKIKSFSEVKELIKKEYIKNKKENEFFNIIKKIEGELKTEEGLNKISNEYNIPIKKITLSKDKVKSQLPLNNQAFFDTAFDTSLLKNSKLFFIDSKANTFCVLNVQKEEKAYIKKYDDVIDILKKIWKKDEISDRVKSFSSNKDIKKKINSLGNIVKKKNITISRENLHLIKDIPYEFLSSILKEDTKYSESFIDHDNKVVFVAGIQKRIAPDLDTNMKYSDLYKSQIYQLEQEAILLDILSELRKKYKIKVNINANSNANVE
jgi:peptidyl-prolyl cis-trans isomerase D